MNPIDNQSPSPISDGRTNDEGATQARGRQAISPSGDEQRADRPSRNARSPGAARISLAAAMDTELPEGIRTLLSRALEACTTGKTFDGSALKDCLARPWMRIPANAPARAAIRQVLTGFDTARALQVILETGDGAMLQPDLAVACNKLRVEGQEMIRSAECLPRDLRDAIDILARQFTGLVADVADRSSQLLLGRLVDGGSTNRLRSAAIFLACAIHDFCERLDGDDVPAHLRAIPLSLCSALGVPAEVVVKKHSSANEQEMLGEAFEDYADAEDSVGRKVSLEQFSNALRCVSSDPVHHPRFISVYERVASTCTWFEKVRNQLDGNGVANTSDGDAFTLFREWVFYRDQLDYAGLGDIDGALDDHVVHVRCQIDDFAASALACHRRMLLDSERPDPAVIADVDWLIEAHGTMALENMRGTTVAPSRGSTPTPPPQ